MSKLPHRATSRLYCPFCLPHLHRLIDEDDQNDHDEQEKEEIADPGERVEKACRFWQVSEFPTLVSAPKDSIGRPWQ
jgi:hypothetical protein